MSGKFDLIVETAVRRLQNQGVLVSDLVKFKDNYEGHDWTKGLGEVTREQLKQVIESGDNLRVSSVKSARPTTADANNFAAVDEFFVDVVQEKAPGLYMNPFTVPMELLEVIDTGINLSTKTPDNQKKEDPSDIKPVEVEENEEAPQAFKDEAKLPETNTTLPGAKGAQTAQYTTKYMDNQ